MAQDDDFIIGGRKNRKSSSQGTPKEFYEAQNGNPPVIIVRLNSGDAIFSILKSDNQIIADGELDLLGCPAS